MSFGLLKKRFGFALKARILFYKTFRRFFNKTTPSII